MGHEIKIIITVKMTLSIHFITLFLCIINAISLHLQHLRVIINSSGMYANAAHVKLPLFKRILFRDNFKYFPLLALL